MRNLIKYLDDNYNGWREPAVILAVLAITAFMLWLYIYIQVVHTDAGLFDSRKNVEGGVK